MTKTAKRNSVMLPIRVPRLDGTKSLRYLPRRVVQAMADHASANLLLGERTVPGRFLVLRLAADEVEREELERQFAESHAVILQEIAREARARDFRLRGELAVRLRTVQGTRNQEEGAGNSEIEPASDTLSPDLWARLGAERELILPERLRTLLVESRPPGAAVYLDNRQMDRVTPCRIAEVPAGSHTIALALPGFMPGEQTIDAPEGGEGEIRVIVDLEAEPPMGILEVVTFPAQATVTVEGGGEGGTGGQGEVKDRAAEAGSPPRPLAPSPTPSLARSTPARLRLPAGHVIARVERADYEPCVVEYDLPPGGESAPGRIQVRLQYAGDDRNEPVGRLIIYKPESEPRSAVDPRPMDRPEDTIASFFRDRGVELEGSSHVAMAGAAIDPEPEILGERPLFKGVLLIGRDDRRALVTPDVKLFDPANTVSRGCHAWLHIYTDPGTGAEFNTFVIHNHSPSGILVNGRLVMESAAMGDMAELKIGIFRMRVIKETPAARVEF